MSEARERAAEAWHQFLLSAVSDGAEPHEVFGWAYMAGWAHDMWPAVADIVPPPDVTGRERDALETIVPEVNPVQPGDRFVMRRDGAR